MDAAFRRGISGRRLLLAMGAAAAVLGAVIYYAAISVSPVEYRDSRRGAPAKAIRIAVASLDWKPEGVAPLAALMHDVSPDFLLLQRSTRADAISLASALNLLVDGKPQVFYAILDTTEKTREGCAILARHRLYRFREVPHGSTDAFAVTAETVIEGQRFLLASAALEGETMAEQSAELRRAPGLMRLGPTICGGLLSGQSLQGMTVVHTAGDFSLLTTPHWRVMVRSPAGEPLWADLQDAGASADAANRVE